MLRVVSTSDVVQVLRRLKEEDPVAFAAVRERIRLIQSDPGHPRSRGVTRKIPGGPTVRAVVIASPRRSWRLAWTLSPGDAVVQVVLLEPEDP